jgi:hypothetical protein
MVLEEPPKQPIVRGIACAVTGFFIFAIALASGLWPDAPLSLTVEDPLVGPLELIHVVDRHRIPGVKDAPFRAFLQHFVRDGATDTSVPWIWREESPDQFFGINGTNGTLLDGLPAGTVVVIDNVMQFKEADTGAAYDSSEKPQDLLLISQRLWDLSNHSKPLVVVFGSGDGDCDTPWPNNTHHVLYRTEWCSKYHDEWVASYEAERRDGPIAGWLRSLCATTPRCFAPSLRPVAAPRRRAPLLPLPPPTTTTTTARRGVHPRATSPPALAPPPTPPYP